MSILGNLSAPEILSLRECKSDEFPGEIRKLTNLRFCFDLLDSKNRSFQANVISTLFQLEVLERELLYHMENERLGK